MKKKNDKSFLVKCLALFFALVIVVTYVNIDSIAQGAIELIQSISENSVSENNTEDFDASDLPVNAESTSPKEDSNKTNLYPEGSPSISFIRYPTQGKLASELEYGEWMFDQEFARGLLFDQFNVARNTPGNWKLKENDGSWTATEEITNCYVWDENLEAVAMQRAIEQIGMDGHWRPDGSPASAAYLYYSATGTETTGNAYNKNAAQTGSLNPYWEARNFNELTYVFGPKSWATIYPEKDYSTDAALAYLIVNDPDLGYMEYNAPSGGQKHRRVILENSYYRIGIGCVRTSRGYVITAVEVCQDTALSGDKIPVTCYRTAEQMENLFSETYVTYAAYPDGSDKLTLQSLESLLPETGGKEVLIYKEGTPVSERPTIDIKQIELCLPTQDTMAMWNHEKYRGADETGKNVSILGDTWVSADPTVATVDGNGIITPISSGITDIRCKGDVFEASLAVEVQMIPLPSFNIRPVASGDWDVKKTADGSIATYKVSYSLVDSSTGDKLKIDEYDRKVTCTTSNPDIAITDSISADGFTGTFTLTYHGTLPAGGMDDRGQLTFTSNSPRCLNSESCWINIVNTETAVDNTGDDTQDDSKEEPKDDSGNSSGTESGVDDTENTTEDKKDTSDDSDSGKTEETPEDTKVEEPKKDDTDDEPADELGKQKISVSAKYAKANTKSKVYALNKSTIKKTTTYDMKVKVKTDGVGHGKVTYKVTYPSGTTAKQKKLFTVKDGKITVKKGVKKGTYKITITAAKVSGLYKKATRAVYVKVTDPESGMKKQTISVTDKYSKATSSSKAYVVKKSKIKKTTTYDMKVKVKTGSTGHGKVSYKVTYPKGTTAKQKKLFTVKKGKITVKKGVKKGTYKITITAAKVSGKYKKATKAVYVKVK